MFMLTSCGDDDDATVEDLSGTYVGTKIELKNCNDPEENINYSGNTADGICYEEDGLTGCILLEMTFSNGTYTTTYTVDLAGFTFSSTDTGTYDPDSGADELCVDGNCGEIEIRNGGDKIIFTGQDPDTGCDALFELEKK